MIQSRPETVEDFFVIKSMKPDYIDRLHLNGAGHEALAQSTIAFLYAPHSSPYPHSCLRTQRAPEVSARASADDTRAVRGALRAILRTRRAPAPLAAFQHMVCQCARAA